MSNKIFLSAFLSILILSTRAQNGKRSTYQDQKFLVSIGADAAIPISNGKSYSYILGAGGQLEFKPSPSIGITGNIAYLSFVKKDIKINGVTSYGGTVAFITALGGIKYTFPGDIFIHGQLGLAHSQSGSGTKFSYQPGIGYDFSRNIDVEIKITGIKGVGDNGSTLNNVGIHIGYNF